MASWERYSNFSPAPTVTQIPLHSSHFDTKATKQQGGNEQMSWKQHLLPIRYRGGGIESGRGKTERAAGKEREGKRSYR